MSPQSASRIGSHHPEFLDTGQPVLRADLPAAATVAPLTRRPRRAQRLEVARAELVRRWLRAFGPATVTDIKWWFGNTLTWARHALRDIDAVEVDLDGTPGFALPDDDTGADLVAHPVPQMVSIYGVHPGGNGRRDQRRKGRETHPLGTGRQGAGDHLQ